MDRLHRLFKIKSEEVPEFQYIGLNIKKNRDNVKLGLNEYKKKKLKCIQVEEGRNLKDRISAMEVTKTRQLIGQLIWLATQTRKMLNA